MNVNLAGLLVSSFIFVLLLALVAPVAGNTAASLAVHQAAEQLAADINRARQAAVSTGVTHEMVFDRENRYYLIKELSSFPYPVRRVDLPPGVNWRRLPFTRISFFPTGRVTQNGTFVLVHPQWQGRVEVVVAPHTGRTRIVYKGEE